MKLLKALFNKKTQNNNNKRPKMRCIVCASTDITKIEEGYLCNECGYIEEIKDGKDI